MTMYFHCFHWLMSTDLLFQSAFCRLCKLIHNWQNGAKVGGLKLGSGHLIWLPLSVHVCLGLVLKYWPLVGTCTCHSYFKLYTVCVLLLLCLSFCHYSPYIPPIHLLIYAAPILMNSMKNHQKLAKTCHYLLARLVVQKLIDNLVLLRSVNAPNTKAMLAFYIEFIKWYF